MSLANSASLLSALLLLLLHLFNGLFQDNLGKPVPEGKTSLALNEAQDDGVLGCSGISWTVRKQSAPRSRQITTPTPLTQFLQAGCSS